MLNTQLHKGFLVRILKDIYADNTLGPLVGFKGGTAAMLIYGLGRFSVDLDFDVLNLEKEEYVFERVGKILATYGDIKDQRKKHFTLFFELSYAKTEHNIKVEMSRRVFESKYKSKYQVMDYFGIPMLVMVPEDMFANKLVAFYDRAERANRDIFDVWFFLQNSWSINKELVEQRTRLTFRETVAVCIAKLEKVPERMILSGMGELLTAKQKDWARTHLKTETLFLLRVMLDSEQNK